MAWSLLCLFSAVTLIISKANEPIRNWHAQSIYLGIKHYDDCEPKCRQILNIKCESNKPASSESSKSKHTN